MRKKRTILSSLVAASILLTSCQKVIQLDLSTTTPQLVIQGDVYDGQGPYTVSISKTVNFDAPNIYPPVNNAIVTISDNGAQPQELSQTTDGTYVTSTLQGIVGHTYTLTVKVDGVTYTGNSTMPPAVDIDTIYYKKPLFGGSKLIAFDFRNPPNKENYYQVIHRINGKPVTGFSVFNNNTDQEEVISYSFMSVENTPPLQEGDTIDVWLECIDKNVFEYYRSANRDSGRSASPANPVSNISNGALGYFNACSVRKKTFFYHK